MTDTEIRIAVAKECGWNQEQENPTEHEEKLWGFPAHKPKWWYAHQLPDYPTDLNAMQCAVRAQDEDFRKHFNQNLTVTARQRTGLVSDLTARDWADAFINVYETRKLISS